MDLLTIRTALLITLPIMLVVVLWRRFKHNVIARDLPAPQHLELLQLEVEYHPARLRVALKVPSKQTLHAFLLSAAHEQIHTWPVHVLEAGADPIHLDLPALTDGLYHVQLDTGTQRTVRQFRLRTV
ncbi:MAG: hypothetical protein IPP83_05275 [Flavobacteriales bacterium]|nr:hypothetical protein [Flavobacteriales bacterium]